MNLYKKFFIALMLNITILLLSNCSSEEFDISNEEPADLTFKQYFDTFKIEAENRGFNFSDYEIRFFLADINEDGIGGFAYFTNNKIVIDRDNWNILDENQREILIFHELGHSILQRRHLNTKAPSGECLSYMRGTREDCFKNLYSDLWREYYLDELFNPNTTLPNWYIFNSNYNENYTNPHFLIEEVDWVNGYYNLELNSDTIPNFMLEVTFKDWRSISDISTAITTDINLNGIYFLSQPRLKVFVIGNNNEQYLKTIDYGFNNDIKFTIRKSMDVYQFFLDEELVHITDIENIDYNYLDIGFSSEIKTDITLLVFD